MEGDKTLIPSSSSITILGDTYNGLLNKIGELEGLVRTYESKIDLKIDYTESDKVYVKEVFNERDVLRSDHKTPITTLQDLLCADGKIFISNYKEFGLPNFTISSFSDKGVELSEKLKIFVDKRDEVFRTNFVSTPSPNELEEVLNSYKKEIDEKRSVLAKITDQCHSHFERQEREISKMLTKIPKWIRFLFGLKPLK